MINIQNLSIQQRLAIKLNKNGERSVRSEHPWVFDQSIDSMSKPGKTGDLAIIFSQSKNKPIGVGLYDADSPIRIKMLASPAVQVNEDFFNARMDFAFAKRTELLQTDTNSYRFLFGENDGFPGLIADVYADTLVVKIYSGIWFMYLDIILQKLKQLSNCNTIVTRLSRKLQQWETYGVKDGAVVYGTLDNPVVEFIEHGVNFSAHVILGHKTGYFLDHRDNRRRVGAMAAGKTVLDVFSYAGGFSVHALAGGAIEVTSVDISKQALEVAVSNGKLNSFTGVHKTLAGDAFALLRDLIKSKKTYDIVVIDPPSFAKSAKEIPGARKKYAELAQLGHQLTAVKGTLVLASCSSRVTADEFYQINAEQLKQSSRRYRLVQQTGHDVDHPVSFLEGAYLKTGYYKLD